MTRCSCGASFPVTREAPPSWLGTMVEFFIDPEDPRRRMRFALSTEDEMQAARALIRMADHQTGWLALRERKTRNRADAPTGTPREFEALV